MKGCKFLALLAAAMGFCTIALADANSRYNEYIERWRDEADRQEAKYGVPAAITLAQGILESAAGRSTLATKGNNHFGIKCHNTWEGDTMLRSDDRPDECFRVYPTAEESFTDHSLFLRRRRYEPLFELDRTDYRAWAEGLSRCGYATDPQYADRLIAIIERYGLATDCAAADVEFILGALRQTRVVARVRGLHCVIAQPGDTYSALSTEYGVSTEKLLEYNDTETDGEIKAWEEVYLQPKHDTAAADAPGKATIGEGEDMHSLAQRYGMKLSALRVLNPKSKGRVGDRLRLR